MEAFKISGGKKLEGEIETKGAKNALFPILAATLLTEEDCIIENVPLIQDFFRMIEILQGLGAKVDQLERRSFKINTKDISLKNLPPKIFERLRGSILFYSVLVHRFKEITLPYPGGCIIGARPIDTHLDALAQLGVESQTEGLKVHLKSLPVPKENLRKVELKEFSVTGTCNALLYAAKLKGVTVLDLVDLDYQVQELLKVLKKMGVKIKEISHHRIVIQSPGKLKGFTHRILQDPLEAGTFIILGLATKSKIKVKKVEFEFLKMFFKKLKEAKFPLEINYKDKSVITLPWKKAKLEKVQSLPFPGIHSDLLPSFAILATQTDDLTLIHDPLYEGRFKYLEEINRMGAKIYFADPHRVIVGGPSKLYGKRLGSIDLRGGASLIIAGLLAEGESIIENIYQIDRGYEQLEKRLKKLGAEIERIKSN